MALVAATLALLAATAFAIPTSLQIGEPITIPLDAGMRPFSEDLPIVYNYLQPHQVHTSPAGPQAVFVNWASGGWKEGKGALVPHDVSLSSSVVIYGINTKTLTLTATGTVEVYSQLYSNGGDASYETNPLNYSSPYLHTVKLTNLPFGARVYYKVGNGTIYSALHQLRVPSAPGPKYPQRVVTIADWGISYNSSTTLQHIVASAITEAPVNPPSRSTWATSAMPIRTMTTALPASRRTCTPPAASRARSPAPTSPCGTRGRT